MHREGALRLDRGYSAPADGIAHRQREVSHCMGVLRQYSEVFRTNRRILPIHSGGIAHKKDVLRQYERGTEAIEGGCCASTRGPAHQQAGRTARQKKPLRLHRGYCATGGWGIAPQRRVLRSSGSRSASI